MSVFAHASVVCAYAHLAFLRCFLACPLSVRCAGVTVHLRCDSPPECVTVHLSVWNAFCVSAGGVSGVEHGHVRRFRGRGELTPQG
eukprot:6091241-Pyramimonas_sp.AAC.4